MSKMQVKPTHKMVSFLKKILDGCTVDLVELSPEQFKWYVDYNEFDHESDFKEDMKWFLKFACYYGIQARTANNEFDVISRDAFWYRLTKEIQQIMEDDGGITPRNRFEIEYRLSMKHDFWFYLDGDLFTFPYFMEYCKGKTFKVTKFLDYHSYGELK